MAKYLGWKTALQIMSEQTTRALHQQQVGGPAASPGSRSRPTTGTLYQRQPDGTFRRTVLG